MTGAGVCSLAHISSGRRASAASMQRESTSVSVQQLRVAVHRVGRLAAAVDTVLPALQRYPDGLQRLPAPWLHAPRRLPDPAGQQYQVAARRVVCSSAHCAQGGFRRSSSCMARLQSLKEQRLHHVSACLCSRRSAGSQGSGGSPHNGYDTSRLAPVRTTQRQTRCVTMHRLLHAVALA